MRDDLLITEMRPRTKEKYVDKFKQYVYTGSMKGLEGCRQHNDMCFHRLRLHYNVNTNMQLAVVLAKEGLI